MELKNIKKCENLLIRIDSQLTHLRHCYMAISQYSHIFPELSQKLTNEIYVRTSIVNALNKMYINAFNNII